MMWHKGQLRQFKMESRQQARMYVRNLPEAAEDLEKKD